MTHAQELGGGHSYQNTGSQMLPVAALAVPWISVGKDAAPMNRRSEGFGTGCIKYQVMSFPFPVTQSAFLNSARIGQERSWLLKGGWERQLSAPGVERPKPEEAGS